MPRPTRSTWTLGLAAAWWLATAFGPRFEPETGWTLGTVAVVGFGYAVLTTGTAWALAAATLGALRDPLTRRLLAEARLPWPVLVAASIALGAVMWQGLPGDPLGRGWLAAASGMTLFVGGVLAAHLALAWRRRRRATAPRPSQPSRPSLTAA